MIHNTNARRINEIYALRGAPLNNCEFPCKYCEPGAANSNLMIKDIAVPAIPLKIANIKYNTAISFAFVDYNHLCTIFTFFLYINFNNIIIIIFIKN